MEKLQRYTPLLQLLVLVAVIAIGFTLHRDMLETERLSKIAASAATQASSDASDAKEAADNAQSEAEEAKSAAQDAQSAIESR